ncbi:MAG: hypothetical protein ACTSUE_05255, partial [Promethearchaeota archaeon]
MTQRADQERLKYLDGTCTYMCGAPIFEFGLWPYVPHIAVILMSMIFLVLYKSFMQAAMHIYTAYLVLGMGLILGTMVIVGLGMGASRNIEDFARRKAQKKKQVLQVSGDESKRGYTVSQKYGPSTDGTSVRRRGATSITEEQASTITSSSTAWGGDTTGQQEQHHSRMHRALSKADESLYTDVESQHGEISSMSRNGDGDDGGGDDDDDEEE